MVVLVVVGAKDLLAVTVVGLLIVADVVALIIAEAEFVAVVVMTA